MQTKSRPAEGWDQGEPRGLEVRYQLQSEDRDRVTPPGKNKGRTCQWVRLGLWGQLLRGQWLDSRPARSGLSVGWVRSRLVKLRCRQQLGAGWTGWICRGMCGASSDQCRA